MNTPRRFIQPCDSARSTTPVLRGRCRSPHRTTTVWSLGGLALLACLMLAGCGGSSATKSSTTADDKSSQGQIRRCQNLLKNAMSRVQPASLGITSTPSAAAMGLNEWFSRCGDDEWADGWDQAVTGLLDAETAARVAAKRFSDEDAQHVRTSLLLNSYAAAIEGRSDEARATGLFYAVVRDMALIPNDAALSLTPFELLMTGRGTAEDRAWVFVAALRQLHLDAFILLPEKADSERWLVGVVVPRGTLLFDPALGLPVYRLADNENTVLPQTPATLADLAGDDEILGKRSSPESDNSISDADFAKPRVAVVGSEAVWAQRCLLLQDALTSDEGATFCDPLQDVGDAPGLVSRILEAGDGLWGKDSVTVWPYAPQHTFEFSHLSERDQGRLTAMWDPFQARIQRRLSFENGSGQIDIGSPEWGLFRGRVDQLRGTLGDSVPVRYQTIRLGKLEREETIRDDDGVVQGAVTIPEDFYLLHARAAENATFWIAVHHFREQNFQTAADGFYSLRRSFPDSVWTPHATYLLAITLAHLDRFDKAAKELTRATEQGGTATAREARALRQVWSRRIPAVAPPADQPPAAKREEVSGKGNEPAAGDGEAAPAKTPKADAKAEDARAGDQKSGGTTAAATKAGTDNGAADAGKGSQDDR